MARRMNPFMTSAAGVVDVLCDAAAALRLAIGSSREALLREWVFVPAGILVLLLACFGIDSLFRLGAVPFPASVACLVLLFVGLLLMGWLVGGSRTRRVVAVVEVPAGWALRWMNVLFVPAFVVLPLSPPIGGAEVGKMIAVFVVGFVASMAATAYGTRFLQLLVGSSKRAQAERAEELGDRGGEIPLSETPRSEGAPVSAPASAQGSTVAFVPPSPPQRSQHPAHTWDPANPADPAQAPGDTQAPRPALPPQAPLPPPRARLWAAYVKSNLDWMTYLAVLLFVGIPVYYAAGYAMPLHLSFTMLMYFVAMSFPARWRQVLHPVIVTALFTVLGLWVLGLARGQALHAVLTEYRTGNKYLQLWEGTTKSHLPPGAGDLFGTVLDASIVSLALPMYQYRRELREHFLAIVVPNTLLSVGSLYAYPSVCYAIGINAPRSLAFASRSLTLALAVPATSNLGGDTDAVSALALMSGIVGVLTGPKIFALLRIPEDDYVTRGVTLGANSSAVATALLLRTDPRAAALSSLSMSLFGTITVLFTSIPPMTAIVRSLVGL